MKKLTAALGLVSLSTAACADRDFGDLPKDPRERALACMRAGVTGLGLAAQADRQDDKARLGDKVRQLGGTTGFNDLFPAAKDDMLAALGGEAAANDAVQGVWLSILNTCLTAYDIAPEPVPNLPTAPKERAAVCAAAVSLDAARGKGIDPQSAVVYDPQGFYFAYKVAQLTGQPPVEGANAAVDALAPVLQNGAAAIFAAQCRSEDPKSVTPQPQPLPADPVITGVICSSALGSLKHGGMAKGAGNSAIAKTYAAGEVRVTTALANLSTSAAAVTAAYKPATDYVVATGNGGAVAEACLRHYPG